VGLCNYLAAFYSAYYGHYYSLMDFAAVANALQVSLDKKDYFNNWRIDTVIDLMPKHTRS